MEKTNDNVRERILSHLPQPANLAAYREETASLLARHEKALFWEKIPSTVFLVCAGAMVIADWFWAPKIGAALNHSIWLWVGLLSLAGTVQDLRHRIYRGTVDVLKEIKQVQLQMLELQTAIEKTREDE